MDNKIYTMTARLGKHMGRKIALMAAAAAAMLQPRFVTL
jgi:hypothetical protein